MKKLVIVIMLFTALFGTIANANDQKERMYLRQLLNQLNAMKPLIIAASKEQPKTNRIAFHYMSYRDSHGKIHNGLIDDINRIEQEIRAKLYHLPPEPHSIPSIKGDYINYHRAK